MSCKVLKSQKTSVRTRNRKIKVTCLGAVSRGESVALDRWKANAINQEERKIFMLGKVRGENRAKMRLR